ncbi:hypothetical protein Nepgr_033529 [Nepenthes gracilis]|uniref:Uncharacterized protein n=1 Tax=Nepenthes gracilis TaxID=150966 RepID=A0AAD3TKL9_NEPGR|nr:hypothetical protein Nepgr_033529 [Nepenthes gracilis]
MYTPAPAMVGLLGPLPGSPRPSSAPLPLVTSSSFVGSTNCHSVVSPSSANSKLSCIGCPIMPPQSRSPSPLSDGGRDRDYGGGGIPMEVNEGARVDRNFPLQDAIDRGCSSMVKPSEINEASSIPKPPKSILKRPKGLLASPSLLDLVAIDIKDGN